MDSILVGSSNPAVRSGKSALMTDYPQLREVGVMREGVTRGGTDLNLRSLQLLDGTPTREVPIQLDLKTERRLRRVLENYAAFECEGVDPTADVELELTLLAELDQGLNVAEAEDGVWSTPDGWCHPLPRQRRCGLRMRTRLAWKAAKTSWRST